MVTDIVEGSAVTVKGRFCGAPNTASGGYVAGLLGRLMEGPSRVSLEQPVPVNHGLAIERLGDGALTLTDGAVALAHASPATLQLEPPQRELLMRIAAGYRPDQVAAACRLSAAELGRRLRAIVRKLQWDVRAGSLTLQLA